MSLLAAHLQSLGLEYQCLSDGRQDAEIVVIGEAPGHRECQLGVPLVGSSGKLLWDALGRQGIRRQHCYITNVVKKQLAFGNEKRSISKNELSHWIGALEWELSLLPNAKYFILLGDVALRAVLGISGIDSYRGSVFSIAGRYYIPMWNPANVLRKPQIEPIFHLDVSKLLTVMSGKWVEHKIEAIYDAPVKDVLAWCDKMINDGKPVSIDIETGSGETVCVGLSNDPHIGMCINFRDERGARFSIEDELRIRKKLQAVVASPRVKLIAQNAMFEATWLWFKDRIKCRPFYFDTMTAHHLLFPTWPHDLGFLVAQYTNHPFYKNDKDEWRENQDFPRFWQYNVKDVCCTLQVWKGLEAELRSQKLDEFYFNHIMKEFPYLVDSTVLGDKIDLDMKQQLAEVLRKECDGLREEFWKSVEVATGDPNYRPNPGSPLQLRELLFGKLRAHAKSAATNKEAISFIISSPLNNQKIKDVALNLLRWREKDKFFGTYVDMCIDSDGRFRALYKQTGVQSAPGRLSSSGTAWGTGTNKQNIPPSARGMFVADEGYVYVYFDLSQAEARVVAWEARIDKWKEQFERARLQPGSYDAHRALAAEMFKIPYDEVPKEDYIDGKHTIRYIAKRCRHGLNYRMQAAKLAAVTGLSMEEASRAYELYHQVTPELKRWWDEVLDEIVRTRKLVSCKGRVLPFFGSRIDEEQLDSIIAFKPQSAVGDHVREVFWKSQEDDKWPKGHARMAFNNHDSCTALVRQDLVPRVIEIIRRYAESPLIIHGDKLIIPAEFAVSVPDERGVHRWSNLKKLK